MAGAARKDAVVTVDAVGYLDEDGERLVAGRGEKVSLSQKDYDRHLEAGNVAAPRSADAKEAAAEAADDA